MKYFKIALEEELLEVDKAIDAVNSENSTDPYDIAKVKTFKEELKEMQDQEESMDDSDDTADSEETDDSEDTFSDNEDSPEDSSDTQEDQAEDQPSEDSVEEDSDNDDDSAEDKDKDTEDEKEDDGSAAGDEATKASESLEHLSYALEVMDEVTLCIKRGSARSLDTLEHSQNFKLLSRIYNSGRNSSIALESLNTGAGYVAEQKQLKMALEGIKDIIKTIIDKIVAFIKGIIKWIKNYFLYDPVKNEQEHQEWKAKRARMQDNARKVRDMATFEERAINAIGKKLYRERANTLVIGNIDNTFDQASKKLLETLDILQHFWDYNTKYLNAKVRPVFSDVFEYKQSKTISDNSKYLIINASEYAPVPLVARNDYRSFSKKQLPGDFNVFVSRSILSGNKVFVYTMPSKNSMDVVESSQKGRAYQGTLISSVDQDGSRKGITYATNFNSLLQLISAVEKSQVARKELSYTASSMVQMLEKSSNQLIAAAKNLSVEEDSDTGFTRDSRNAFIERIRFNLAVFNNVINSSMTESVLYYKRVTAAVDDWLNSNSKILESVQEDIADKRESLGINA